MEAHEMTDLLNARRQADRSYFEFLRKASLSAGIYEIPAGARDTQSPHSEDEVYYVVRGRARVRVGAEDREVRPGSLIFVPAREEHRFHDIVARLTLLVIFAPPESQGPRPKIGTV